jgi:hypothetical protein
VVVFVPVVGAAARMAARGDRSALSLLVKERV